MKDTWKIFAILSVLFGLAIGILSIVRGDCGGVVECTNGTVPMKCHWTFMVTAALGFGTAVMSLAGLAARTKEARRFVALAVLLLLVIALVVLYPLIGVCAVHDCLGNRTVLTVIIAVNMLIMIIGCVKADPNKVDLPKAKL